jgi:hypothetical protein
LPPERKYKKILGQRFGEVLFDLNYEKNKIDLTYKGLRKNSIKMKMKAFG